MADLVNPKTGLTWRQENEAMYHAIKIGSLVEIKETGARLFVAKYGRDCDGTPLYHLSHKPIDELTERDYLCNLIRGYSDGSLVVIRE
jgi:hypothetical protein